MSSSQTKTPSDTGVASLAAANADTVAPCGSWITAIRPTSGMSIGGATMLPPASSARFPAASASSTATCPSQWLGTPSGAGPNPPCVVPLTVIIG
jgi:hypothetical protein